MDFVKLFTEVAGLSAFIFAGVAQLKQFGIEGKALTISAYAFGLLFGGLYRFFAYPPQSSAEWFWLVVFGMAGGFIATGVYKGVESATGAHEIKENISWIEVDTADDIQVGLSAKPK